MKWRIRSSTPEIVEQIPISENYGLRRFRIRFQREDAATPANDDSILDAAKEFLQIEGPTRDVSIKPEGTKENVDDEEGAGDR